MSGDIIVQIVLYHKISRNKTKTTNQIHSTWLKEITIFFFLFLFENANSFWNSLVNNYYPISTVEIVLNASEQCNSWNIWIDSFNSPWHTQITIRTFFWKYFVLEMNFLVVWASSWPVVLTTVVWKTSSYYWKHFIQNSNLSHTSLSLLWFMYSFDSVQGPISYIQHTFVPCEILLFNIL